MSIVDVMIDAETLDTKAGAVILQISAVPFNRNTGEIISRIFVANIDSVSCQKKGMTINADTVMWWLKQSKEAQNALFDPVVKQQDINSALAALDRWIEDIKIAMNATRALFWCHANFDYPILTRAFEMCDRLIPWSRSDVIDLRTLINLTGIKPSDFADPTDVAHIAVSDCMYQIRYAVAAYKKLQPIAAEETN